MLASSCWVQCAGDELDHRTGHDGRDRAAEQLARRWLAKSTTPAPRECGGALLHVFDEDPVRPVRAGQREDLLAGGAAADDERVDLAVTDRPKRLLGLEHPGMGVGQRGQLGPRPGEAFRELVTPAAATGDEGVEARASVRRRPSQARGELHAQPTLALQGRRCRWGVGSMSSASNTRLVSDRLPTSTRFGSGKSLISVGEARTPRLVTSSGLRWTSTTCELIAVRQVGLAQGADVGDGTRRQR